MKKSVLLLGGAVVVAVAVATLLTSRESARPDSKQTAEVKTTRINKEFDIAGGAVQSVSFEAPRVPGTLSGKWHSTGKGGNDTLSGFTLTDPSDAVLDSSFKRSSSGSFQVKVNAAGRHTFVFENTGHKQAARHVMLDAEFKPD
jgi:emp24/gp25L/p24 family/GOLD